MTIIIASYSSYWQEKWKYNYFVLYLHDSIVQVIT